jgi:hypothetical protein
MNKRGGWFMRPRKGYALATILVLLGVCMFGAAALITISILESRISRSQIEGTVAYYVAEAGVNDAVWRLNTDINLRNALAAGTLNSTYSFSDRPAAGQGFSVVITTADQGAGYASIEVTGAVDNGNFVARRKIRASVFLGAETPAIGGNSLFGGGNLSVTNGGSSFTFVSGDLYSRGKIVINQANIQGPNGTINAVDSYSAQGSTVNVAGIYASNYPPAPIDVQVPGYNFAQYLSLPTDRCTAALYAAQQQLRCTPSQFQALLGSESSFTFNNAVVFIDGGLQFNAWAKDKQITFNGLLVVRGDLSMNDAAKNLVINITNPGNDLCGIVVAGNINNSMGTWNVQGVYYASGSASFTNPNGITINGAIIAGGNININTGLYLDLSFNSGPIIQVIGGQPNPVRVLHWEEEY